MAGKILSVFSEGSLLKRTLFHVGTFLVGSVAFIAVTSFVLVSVATGIAPASSSSSSRHTAAASSSADADTDADDEADAPGSPAGPKAKTPGAPGRHVKKGKFPRMNLPRNKAD